MECKHYYSQWDDEKNFWKCDRCGAYLTDDEAFERWLMVEMGEEKEVQYEITN